MDATGSASSARRIQRSRTKARGMSLADRSRQTPGGRQADAVQADPARHRTPHPDRRMAAGSSHPVRAPTDDALWLLANDREQGAVGTGASRSHRAAAAGRHLCAPSQIPVGGPDDSRHPRGDHRARPQLRLSVDPVLAPGGQRRRPCASWRTQSRQGDRDLMPPQRGRRAVRDRGQARSISTRCPKPPRRILRSNRPARGCSTMSRGRRPNIRSARSWLTSRPQRRWTLRSAHPAS